MDKLRIAVVGCKNMGKKHVAVLRGHFADRVEIAGILNSSAESSARVAAELNVPYFKNLDDIDRETADAVGNAGHNPCRNRRCTACPRFALPY